MYEPTTAGMSMSASPLDIDSFLYEIALARNSVAWATMGSSSRRPRASSRVTKPGSAGNSPTRLQRRRTSASHKFAKYRSELYPHTPSQPSDGSVSSASATIPSRPLSWHPSTMMSAVTSNPDYRSPPNRYSYEYQTVDVNGMPTPLTQPDLRPAFPVNWPLNLDTPVMYPDNYGYSSASSHQRLDTYPSASMYGSVSSFQPSSIGPSTVSPGVPSMQSWSVGPSQAMAFTAPPTPDVLPIQRPTDPLANADDASPRDSDTKRDVADDNDDDTELVGMGLYDGPVAPSFLLDGVDTHSATSSPTGKGLKLEETWAPPPEEELEDDDEDDADGEDDDDMSSDLDSVESLPIEKEPDSASLAMPIERPDSLYSPTVAFGMPMEKTDQIVSPSSMHIPIQLPNSAKFSLPIDPLDSASIHMPIEHPDSLSPVHPAFPGRTFYLEREGRSMDEVHQLWVQAMLMQGMDPAMSG